jgi:SAM-dependent methyltransferase
MESPIFMDTESSKKSPERSKTCLRQLGKCQSSDCILDHSGRSATKSEALMLKPTPCNLCGVDDATVIYGPGVAQRSQIVRCNRCGLMYASPRAKEPDHVEIAEYDPNWDAITHQPQRYIKERLQVRDYARTRALLNRLYPDRGKLLEIGSGYGFLLAEFKKDGWDVQGVEPNGFCCRYTRATHGIEAFSCILEDAGLADQSFDVVLLNHVIEHMDDPLRTLREINRVLKLNGHFIVETPRYDTLMFKLLGRRERSLNCNGHIYFFTTRTLQNFYQAAGFQLIELDYVGRSLTIGRLMWNLGVMSKSDRVQRFMERISGRLQLDKVHLYLNMRDMQRACVKKVASVLPVQHPVLTAPGAASR